jgi:hypothetical protein
VANYGISDSVVNWRLLFDIVSWELGEVPLRLGTKINGQKFKGRIDDSKPFKAVQSHSRIFRKKFLFSENGMEEWRWSLCLGVFVVHQLGGPDAVSHG